MTVSDRATAKSHSFSAASLLVWSIAFSLVYSQAPLFSSNQNQYFLHGLARAGYGMLRPDWLANTIDPTPVFSFLVQATYQWLPLGAFYLWVLGLMCVYVFSLEGLASGVFDLRDDPVKHRIFLALLVIGHSALARFALLKTLGDEWSYVLEGGLAGQRLLGSVLEPSMFGVFLLLSIYLFDRRRTALGVVCAAAAATIHPTYLLSAGILTIAYTFVAFRDGDRMQAVRVPALALILVIPILAYTAIHFVSGDPASLAQAQDILVESRIPHHALIQAWWNPSALVQILFVVAGIALARKTRLSAVMTICAGAVLALTAIQAFTGNKTLALIFPWRPSTFLVPMGMTFCLGFLVENLWRWRSVTADALRRRGGFIGRAALSLVLLLALAGLVKFRIDREQSMASPARAMMTFVRNSLHTGEVYMIPPYLQDFRLDTGAPILVDFKSIPYQPKEVIQWYDRLLLARRVYRDQPDKVSCRALREATARYGVTHVVLDASQFGAACGPWVERYRDAAFVVYELVPG